MMHLLTEIRPYFAGRQSIPNLAHVIVIPNSLLAQWYSELRTFFAPKSIEIYHYPTAEKEFDAFWTGHWAISTVPMINRVILVPHSVSLIYHMANYCSLLTLDAGCC
jgi:SNF2 family DNA or RNA helicase